MAARGSIGMQALGVFAGVLVLGGALGAWALSGRRTPSTSGRSAGSGWTHDVEAAWGAAREARRPVLLYFTAPG